MLLISIAENHSIKKIVVYTLKTILRPLGSINFFRNQAIKIVANQYSREPFYKKNRSLYIQNHFKIFFF